MKSILAKLLLIIFTITGLSSSAQNMVKVDDILYLIEEDHAVVARQDKNLSGDIIIPEFIVYQEVSYPVTRLIEPTRSGGVASFRASILLPIPTAQLQKCI